MTGLRNSRLRWDSRWRSAGRLLVAWLVMCTLSLYAPKLLWGDDPPGALETPKHAHIVTGILAMLDLSARKGMLKTDLDKPIFFELSRPEQFNHLSIGDRVTVQLDENGQVLKIIETLPSEVHEPPPPAK